MIAGTLSDLCEGLRYAQDVYKRQALALTLLVMPSSASGGLFFLSLNDTLPAQSVQMTPVQYSGWVYVLSLIHI